MPTLSRAKIRDAEPNSLHRRSFLERAAFGAIATPWLGGLAALGVATPQPVIAQAPGGERPKQDREIEILHPLAKTPASFFIDDSTCLVNMGHFCMPQFAAAWPDREIYRRPWQKWPREIPDSFVREFGEWCAEHGVKGKYSVVPYPACVGWLDRELPGWSRRQLQESLKLVRELMLPHWDIHPEMITHTRAIDLATGRPFAELNSATMENSYPQTRLSVDQLAAYLAYALRILRNCDLPCAGITTPGGFGNTVKSELSLAVGQAVRDVFPEMEIPHYFKYVRDGAADSTLPQPEHVTGLGTDQLRYTMNVPAGTGDWFGGWDGDRPTEGQKYANQDASSGRMVELIERNEPAVMLCHWPGLYCHGEKHGFRDFQRVVLALEQRFAGRIHWMKISELARYGAARSLTTIERVDQSVRFTAPVTCPDFTVRLPATTPVHPKLMVDHVAKPLEEATDLRQLRAGRWTRDGQSIVVCFALPKGKSQLV
jgi:hypothetical protein